MLFAIHSGLRYLVLLAGFFVILYATIGLLGKREYSAMMQRLASTFAGLIHLQVVVGLLVMLFARPFYSQLMGHLFMMLAAALVAQFTTSVVKRRPPEAKSYGPHLVGGLIALICIAGGVLAIGRGLLQSTV